MSANRRAEVVVWALLQGLAGVAVVVVAVLVLPVPATIGPAIAPIPPDARVAVGVAGWLIFGLLGGARARPRPGGSVLTFSMPFIVAATLLGGPAVGGVMGLLSDWDPRELRTTPWYGTLANHGVSALSAVVAGTIGVAAEPLLAMTLGGASGAAFAVQAALVAFVFATLNVALVVPTLALRNGIGVLEASRSYDASFRATSVAEAVLAWLMAATYVEVGWWAPVVCIVLVLAVWRAHDQREELNHDPMTGLLNDAGFEPFFRAAHEAAQIGRRAYALLVMDLDGFRAVNNHPRGGHAAGDEVIRAIGRRIFGAVRATDYVVRFNRAGDEFGALFTGVGSLEVAVMLARRIEARVREPVHIRESGWTAQVGGSIGIVVVERGASLDSADVKAAADRLMYEAKKAGGGIRSTVIPGTSEGRQGRAEAGGVSTAHAESHRL